MLFIAWPMPFVHALAVRRRYLEGDGLSTGRSDDPVEGARGDGPAIVGHARASLEAARLHAMRLLFAWLIASGAVLSLIHTFGDSVGWVSADHRVRGHVVEIKPDPEGEIVFWEAEGPNGRVYWSRSFEDSEWDVGDPIEGWITDGRFYQRAFASWMGPVGGLLWMGVLTIIFFVSRRLLGIVIAIWDLGRGRDHPRPGYAALVENPVPRAWRPLILIWWQDPSGAEKPPSPDHAFLADDVTGADLMSETSLRVMEGSVDSGPAPWMKPRWVAVTGGVLVPHRRALLARAMALSAFRDSTVKEPVPFKPSIEPIVASQDQGPSEKWHERFSSMVLIRVGAVVAIAVLSRILSEGHPVTPAL